MSIDRKQVVKALGKVIDPNTGRDILSVHMVEGLEIDGNDINFKLVLPSLQNEYKQDLNFACIGAIQEIYPNANVNVHMMAKTAQAGESTSSVPHIKNVIAVASGKGGVGKSTIAANLAIGLKNLGAKVGLVDADLYGPSMPTMFGLQGQRPKVQTVYNQPRITPLMAYGIPIMSIGFIVEPEQAVVLRGPRLSGIIKQFINDCTWPDLDFLIIDLPPGTGDIQLTLVQTVPVTGAIIVTTPQEVAVVDAVKAMNMFLLPSVNVPIIGVVENMSWFTPEELPDNKYYLFGEGGGKRLAKMSKSVLLGQIPLVQGIRESGDAGKPALLVEGHPAARYFDEMAKNTLRQVAIGNEMLGPTKKVNVK